MKIRIQRTQVFAIRSILNRSRDTNFTIIKSLGLKRERIARTNRRFLQWGGEGGGRRRVESKIRVIRSLREKHIRKRNSNDRTVICSRLEAMGNKHHGHVRALCIASRDDFAREPDVSRLERYATRRLCSLEERPRI